MTTISDPSAMTPDDPRWLSWFMQQRRFDRLSRKAQTGASLITDFASGVYEMGYPGQRRGSYELSDIVKVSRSTGGGRVNSSGVYEWVGNDVPRLTHNPVTLQPLGLLIEEQRTNLRTNSANAGLWGKNSANLNATITAFAAPKSGEFLWETTDGGSGDDFFAHYGSVPNDSLPYTASIFVKKTTGVLNACALGIVFSGGTLTAGFVTLDTNTGEVLTVSTVVSASAEDFGGLWRLIITVANNASGNVTVIQRFYPAYKLNAAPGATRDNAVTGSVNVWGSQLELGATPSSYIPTESTQVTRAADVCSVNTLSPWYNAGEGTFVVRAATTNNSFATVFQFSDGTPSNEIRLIGWNDSSNRLSVIQGGSGFAPALSGQNNWLPRTGAPFKIAAAYKMGVEFSYAGSGGVPVKRLSPLSPAGINQLRLGSTVGNLFFLNGIIASVEYYPRVIDVQQASA